MKNPILWITVANSVYLLSYSVRDILWLRILTVAAASLLIPYYALQVAPLQTAIDWSVIFIVINLYWIVRLVIERRPVRFTDEEERLRQLSFPSLTPREARDLYAMGAWDDVEAGTSLVRRDRDSGRFSVILRGDAEVMYRGRKIAQLGEGQFTGGIDLHADTFGDLDILMLTRARVVSWPRDRLRAFVARRPDVALALEHSIGFELQRLLHTMLTKLVPVPESTTLNRRDVEQLSSNAKMADSNHDPLHGM